MARKLVFDRLLFAGVLILTLLGLVMVYSSTAALARGQGVLGNTLFLKHCAAAVLGLALMLVVMHLDYRVLKRPAVIYSAVLAATVLLVLVLFGGEVNGSRRWFRVAGLSFQPSELAKLVVIAYTAYQIDKKRDRIDSYAFLVPVAGLTLLIAALIVAGKDLATTVLLCVPVALMVFLAGVSWRYVAAGAVIALPLLMVFVVTQEYRMRRWTAFLSPEDDPRGAGFQLLQSLIAVGSGGLFGLGPGNSLQKLHFLPSPHADFVFSIVAEELGFLGSLVFVGLFALVLWRGVVAGLHAPEMFGRYLCWGLTALVVSQALVHMSVALGVVPTTGVPLPFISHGGSSLLTMLVASGLLLNISQHGDG
ncbi:MAG: putative lipid II flippase FtsW [Holophagales bacterium]|nr:putative lipid II flippase FtsW [Holophagales bacterium]